MKHNFHKLIISILFISVLAPKVFGQEGEDMSEMSLEDLMNMEVTSVSKKAERLQDVASSIYVVSSDDIMKSGATTLHEVLRNVPGYWGVQDEYSSVYATVRNSPTGNAFPGTVLYLLDGTPIQDLMESTFSFQNFDIPLDEIDRIEVITGSGGTVYGANSATGVINIFTKNPQDYDGVNARVEGAAPGYVTASVRAGGKVSEKVAISGYGKFRLFNGWDALTGLDEHGNTVTNDDEGNPITIPATSEFTEDYNKSTYYSLGAKLNFAMNEKASLSARVHFNAFNKYTYTSSYGTDFAISRDDKTPIANDVNANRLVANIRYDHAFSEDHSIFLRASTNIENNFYRIAGGMDISNAIYDFEIQDNVSLGAYNDLSIGMNFRSVQFDIHDINDPTYINYVDPQSSESIKGAFIQDKVKLMDGKLNFILGIKAENYSLVNDDYYLSPMAKVSFIANDNLTIWGGYTQSFTTPGFNNTNVDWFLFQAPTATDLEPVVTQAVYQGAYDQAIAGNATPDQAIAIADAFIVSPTGEATIAGGIQATIDNTPNIAVQNGSKTVPTKFRTFEIGFKAKLMEKIQIQSTFFKTAISDGIAVNSGNPLDTLNSQTQNREAAYYFYGNYVKGESIGLETMIKIIPSTKLMFEISHTWLETEWKYQENDDFDISTISGNPNPDPSFVPKHVFRFRTDYEIVSGLNFSASLITTSEFRTRGFYYYGTERYQNLVEGDVFSGSDSNTGRTEIAKNDTRMIVNLRLSKSLMDNKLSIYGFGNDITNSGMVANTSNLKNVTLSQIGAMYGLGLNYKFK